jgi:hypothetical protein
MLFLLLIADKSAENSAKQPENGCTDIFEKLDR